MFPTLWNHGSVDRCAARTFKTRVRSLTGTDGVLEKIFFWFTCGLANHVFGFYVVLPCQTTCKSMLNPDECLDANRKQTK